MQINFDNGAGVAMVTGSGGAAVDTMMMFGAESAGAGRENGVSTRVLAESLRHAQSDFSDCLHRYLEL